MIVYLASDNASELHYRMEPLKFGLLPTWAKPQDPAAVKRGTSEGPEYSREVQRHQSKYFNCRKESLASNQQIWTGPRKHTRCVVPINGYFEWLTFKNAKTPHFVHSTKSSLVYLAGLYSHNTNYNNTKLIKGELEYFSSFTIVTGPAAKTDDNDLSWLHGRKPIMIEPGTEAWFEWLDPKKEWHDSLLETCLNTTNNVAFSNIEAYLVGKEVGNLSNKSESVTKREKKVQKSIGLFFQKLPVKRPKSEDDKEAFGGSVAKKIKEDPETK